MAAARLEDGHVAPGPSRVETAEFAGLSLAHPLRGVEGGEGEWDYAPR